ncbi:HNH endonuclease family protein [Symbioplanes lichenis]|uniref:HNH endonuclease family protein n=1 Tax=Symbioplanes lichenis TaxID=1629072 RepID=UPI002738EE09|nr:HNH endonuclease family protein [Actinoplanes lichenis]
MVLSLRVAAAALLAVTAAGCDVQVTDGSGSSSSSDGGNGGGTGADAKSKLGELTVVAKTGSMSGYSREKFPHWRDTGSNCDVRDSVLKRDGKNVKFSGCNVVAGTWISFYDGDKITDPAKVDIDHTVPLANAWRSGANKWTTEKRGDFANDLDDPQLLAVSASSNRSKGDQDPSTWKPEQRSSWCEYAEDWITVKSVWKLTVTAKEKAALDDMLATC